MLVDAMVGGISKLGSGGMVSVMIGSRVGVVAGVDVYSCVGDTVSEGVKLVALSSGSAVGWIVAGETMVWVGVGEEVAVAGTQAVRKASRVQVRNKRRCISKLYS
jgi:hypothetical protein